MMKVIILFLVFLGAAVFCFVPPVFVQMFFNVDAEAMEGFWIFWVGFVIPAFASFGFLLAIVSGIFKKE